MLRLRRNNGTTEEVSSDVSFVEICDDNGNIAAVIYKADRKISVLGPGDKKFNEYIRLFRKKDAESSKILIMKSKPAK